MGQYSKVPCNNGAYIDIFPLDGYDGSAACKYDVKRLRFRNIIEVNNYHRSSAGNHKLVREAI